MAAESYSYSIEDPAKNSKRTLAFILVVLLHVLFFCPMVAKGAVFGMARKDKELSARELGAALVPTERYLEDAFMELTRCRPTCCCCSI